MFCLTATTILKSVGVIKISCQCAQIDLMYSARASTLSGPGSWYVDTSPLSIDAGCSFLFQKYQLWRPPKTGSFFMWKTGAAFKDLHSIRFWGFSPSCSCATFVAIKTFRFFKGLAKWRIGLCAEMQLARQWLQMHFVMHACWKKLLCRWKLWQQKKLQILHHVLDPKMGVEKWTQKWCQNLTPKMGSKNGTPKWGAKIAPKKGFKCK